MGERGAEGDPGGQGGKRGREGDGRGGRGLSPEGGEGDEGSVATKRDTQREGATPEPPARFPGWFPGQISVCLLA